ncbi:MAG: hypothetical protein ACI845_000006 [Gammaproteobacteria bacterium]|jgi:hypothetical protein
MEYTDHLGAEKCITSRQYNPFEFNTLMFNSLLELSVLANHLVK